MLKLIMLVLGLLIGFGGGVYWAHHNPEAAARLSEEEERRFLEAQLAITQRIQAKLEELSGKTASPSPPGASGFISSAQADGAAATRQDVAELRAETQKQEDELKKRIAELQ